MSDVLVDESLSSITAIDKILKSINTIVSLTASVSNSSDLMGILTDVEKEIRILESEVSVLPLRLKNLLEIYGAKLTAYSDDRLEMLLGDVSEEDLISCGISTLPSNDRVLTDINISTDEMDSTYVVSLDDVVNQKEYSYISIVKRLKEDENVLFLVNQYMGRVLQDFIELINEYKSVLLNVRLTITDSEKITTLYDEENARNMLDLISSGVNGYTYRINDAKTGLYKLYQIFLALRQNYEIYHEIVAVHIDKVTESYFNEYSTYEIH